MGYFRGWTPDRRQRACVRRWHLQTGDQMPGGFRSEVVRCKAADGAQVVVKLVETREEMRAEAAVSAASLHRKIKVSERIESGSSSYLASPLPQLMFCVRSLHDHERCSGSEIRRWRGGYYRE